ncbi:PEP-CTERM sorting domain-containing protein [Verrucomicrobiaceae bacterium N1E253]|uniref:PEP-CTERM sorting domain-containing protein n=2 Tax=Oceaniferula marina TaxID=2748318 RepID=A0A851G9V4_9BACT|nr:PEP-CTERM sorting domain-containing protein [Oceaniferula marina]
MKPLNEIIEFIIIKMKTQLISTALAVTVTVSSQAALYLQLTADDLGLTQGADVTSWTDSASGNVFGLESGASASTAPSYETNYNGSGHAAVLFDGVDDFLQDTSLAGTTPNTAEMTVFVVGQFVSYSNTRYLLSAQNNTVDSGDNRLRLAISGSDWRTRVGDGSNIDTSGDAADSDHHVFSIVSGQNATNAVVMQLDGSAILTGTHGTTANAANLDRLNLGAFSNVTDSTKDWANGYIAEIRIYDTSMTDAEINTIHNELSAKYAPVPEPSSAALLGLGGIALILRRSK